MYDNFKAENTNIHYCSLKLHYNIDLETPVNLNIPILYNNENKIKILKNSPAMLIINKEDKFVIPPKQYNKLIEDLDRAYESFEDLSNFFKYDDTDSIMEMLDYIGCFEVTDLKIEDVNSMNMLYVKNNKLMMVNENDNINNGWKEIAQNTYCLLPFSKYIILGSIEDGPIRIIMYQD